ncbi:hypothetical protein ACFE04_025665 [Oxalis oulophora]
MKGVMIIYILLIVSVTIVARPSESAVSCADVNTSLYSCIDYLTAGGTPSVACCAGVKRIKSMAQTITDRRVVCRCLKAATTRIIPSIVIDDASFLPQKCGVQANIPLSQNVNCDK